MRVAEDAVWRDIELLYREEIALLQAGNYPQWLELFDENVRYRAPVVGVADRRDDVVAKDGELAYFDESRETLELRVNKLASTMAWTEFPPSRLRYFVQLTAAFIDGDCVTAKSNFLVFQTRHESHENMFYGERTDRLHAKQKKLLISERRIIFDRSRLPSENLALFF